MKSREVELGSHSPGEMKSREVELGSQSPGEMKSREVELGVHSWMHCLAAELLLHSCFLNTVCVTLFRTAGETANTEVDKLLGTGEVPTSLTLLFWRWLTISTVFTGWSAGTIYS